MCLATHKNKNKKKYKKNLNERFLKKVHIYLPISTLVSASSRTHRRKFSKDLKNISTRYEISALIRNEHARAEREREKEIRDKNEAIDEDEERS